MYPAGEIIQVHIGQAGVQIANACWELYCLEHGINSNGCLCRIPEDNSFQTFFSLATPMKVVPRVIMVDTEPTVIDEIRTGWYRHLFHPDTLITGKEDSGSNFVRGYSTIGSEMIDITLESIRHLAEKCHNHRGFLVFRAIGGGTGSGFGNLIMEKLQEEYGKISKVEFIVFPSPSMAPLIVEPYNAVFSTHFGMEYSDCSFIMDNEALYDICARKLDVSSPTYTNLNRIIGQVVSSFTANQRFDCGSHSNIQELQTNLVPYPRMHFPLVSYAPLINVLKSRYGQMSVDQLLRQSFEPASQLVQCNPANGKYMACVLLYRGDVSPRDVNASVSRVKDMKTIKFVDWSPTGFKIEINQLPPTFVNGGDLAATDRALLALCNNTAIERSWCRLIMKFHKLFNRKAFLHHFVEEGMDEGEFREAYENICTLIRDYQEAK